MKNLFWFLGLCFAVAIYFGCTNFRVEFLRSESGAYLNTAASGWSEISSFLLDQFRHSYNGHYTPLAFSIEMLQAWLLGPNAWLWTVRQVVVFSLAGMMFYLALRDILTPFAGRLNALALAGALTIVLMVQPAMLDMAAWPFMVMQFLYLALFAATFRALGRLGQNPADRRALVTAALCGYGAMHVFGTGLAVALSLDFCLIGLWLTLNRSGFAASQRFMGWAVVLLTLLILGHGAMMLQRQSEPVNIPQTPLEDPIAEFFGMTIDLAFVAVRSLWAPDAYPWPNTWEIPADAPYGFAFLALLLGIGVPFLRESMGNRDEHGRQRSLALVYYFAVGNFVLMVGMIFINILKENIPDQIIGYFVGSRYLTLLSAPLIVIAAISLRNLKKTGVALWVAGCLAVGAVSGSLVFELNTRVHLWPASELSTAEVWSAALAYAHESLATHEPMAKVWMYPVSTTSLDDYTPLLRRELKLTPEQSLQFVETPRNESPSMRACRLRLEKALTLNRS